MIEEQYFRETVKKNGGSTDISKNDVKTSFSVIVKWGFDRKFTDKLTLTLFQDKATKPKHLRQTFCTEFVDSFDENLNYFKWK